MAGVDIGRSYPATVVRKEVLDRVGPLDEPYKISNDT